jgi:hypothetical protein
MFCDPQMFGVPGTPVQRAICRAVDGVPLGELWDDPAVRATFGGAMPPPGVPKMFLDIGPIRRGKSLFVAALAATRTQTVDLSRIGKGEAGPRIPIVSVDKDKAQVVYRHLVGKLESSPVLSALIADKPTKESVIIAHPSGVEIEVCTVAGSRAGSTLVARWVACAIFDEATLMLGQDESVIALEDMLTQLEGRVLPGGQVVLLGSTIAPPRGPAYELLIRYFGRPGDGVVACWSTGPEARPDLYTPAHCASLKPDVRRATCERMFLDLETAFLSSEVIEQATRRTPVERPPEPGHHYRAAADPSSRKNSWTFVILGNDGEKYYVAVAREWFPEPGGRLDPRAILSVVSALCSTYGIDTVYSDQYQADAYASIAEEFGLGWSDEALQGLPLRDAFLNLERLLEGEELELPPVPELSSDLANVRRRTAQNGEVSFVLGKSGRRHCDFASALARVCIELPEPPEAVEKKRTLDEEIDAHVAATDGQREGAIAAALRRVAAA